MRTGDYRVQGDLVTYRLVSLSNENMGDPMELRIVGTTLVRNRQVLWVKALP